MKYSWILPAYNEAESLPELLSEISLAMKKKDYEIILVNDGSTDKTKQFIKNVAKTVPRLKIINFKIRMGKWPALREGISRSKGDLIITTDSDLQDDPSEIGKLISKLNSGFDLVSGWRKIRKDSAYKVSFSKFGSRLATLRGLGKFKDINSPFKIYRRTVLSMIPTEGSLLRFSPLFAKKLGFKVTEVEIKHRKRKYGKSKFGPIKYLRIIFDLVLIKLLFSGSGNLKKSHRL